MKIVITGSRDWTDRLTFEQIVVARMQPTFEFAHGAHWAGIDKMADELLEAFLMPVTPFPANWKAYGNRAGPLRNAYMLDVFKPQEVWGFIVPELACKGTRGCLEFAKERGIRTRTFFQGQGMTPIEDSTFINPMKR